MKRKQIAAVLLSAILSVSACPPVCSISVFAAEFESTQVDAMEQVDALPQENSQQSGEAFEENDNEISGPAASETTETEVEANTADTSEPFSVIKEETVTEENAEYLEDTESERLPDEAASVPLSEDTGEEAGKEEIDNEISGPAASETTETEVEANTADTSEPFSVIKEETVTEENAEYLEDTESERLPDEAASVPLSEDTGEEAGKEEILEETNLSVDDSDHSDVQKELPESTEAPAETETLKTDAVNDLTEDNHLKAYAEGFSTNEGIFYVSPGDSVELKVNAAADDTSQLKYTWYEYKWHSSNIIEGADSAVYRIDSVSYPSGRRHQYYCTVTDQYGNSEEVRFSIYVEGLEAYAAGTKDDWANLYIVPGDAAELKVDTVAPETSQLKYTWYQGYADEGRIIEEADSAVYKIASVLQNCCYSCKVQDQHENSAKTIVFHVYADNKLEAYADGTKDDRVVIYSSPVEETVLKVSATAVDSTQLKYTWYKNYAENETIIAGADSAEYKIGSETANSYICVVSDQYGNSSQVTFEIKAFQAYADEENLDVSYGEAAELKVIVEGADTSQLTYSWYIRPDEWDPELEEIEGAAGTVYRIDSVTKNQTYCCIVSSPSSVNQYVYFDVHIGDPLKAYVFGTKDNTTNLHISYGESAELKVSATAEDNGKLEYTWYSNYGSTVIAGADPSTAKTGPLSRNDDFTCEVKDQYGNTQNVYFYVYIDGTIEAYVDGTKETNAYMTVSPGETVDLKVSAKSLIGDTLTYEWRSFDYNDFEEVSERYMYRQIFGSNTPVLKNVAVRNSRRDLYCEVSDSSRNRVKVYFHINSLENSEPVEVFCDDVVPVSTQSYPCNDVIYKFIPQKAAKYVFYCTEGNYNPILELLDDQMHCIGKCEKYGNDWNSKLTVGLEAGKTYYLIAYDDEYRKDLTNMHIELFKGDSREVQPISAQDLSLVHSDSKKITVDGAHGALSFSSSNNAVASVNNDGVVTAKAPGTATITISADGTDEYLPSESITITVTVTRQDIKNAAVTGLTAKTYNGKGQTQSPVVKIGTTILTAGTDYTVSYKNNTNTGTATVTLTGKGNYTGTKSATFVINKAAQNIAIKVSAASIAVGKTATVSITGAVGAKSYKSSLAAVAAVNAAGTVTAKKVGSTTITATAAATANYKAVSRTVSIKVVPAATSSITAANQATGIKLTWKSVAGATGYKVYRGATLIKTIKGSTVTYTDTKANTNGTKYTFKVIPTASTGNGLAKTLTTYRVARPAVSSAKNTAAKKMTVKWKKNAKANGYQIQYSTNKKFAKGNKTANVTKAATVSKVIGGLAKGKTYYVRIRTYKTVGKAKYWSAWSPAKSVKISK